MSAHAESETAATLLTRLMLSIFRVHGALLGAGDRLVAPLGLSSARWQVLGAVATVEGAATIPAVAALMGLTRQAVLKQVNQLVSDGLIETRDNPAHRRSAVLALTRRGTRLLAAATAKQRRWVRALAREARTPDLHCTLELLTSLTEALERERDEKRDR
jgi:DNA-binding MarR family transcriptional regulator